MYIAGVDFSIFFSDCLNKNSVCLVSQRNGLCFDRVSAVGWCQFMISFEQREIKRFYVVKRYLRHPVRFAQTRCECCAKEQKIKHEKNFRSKKLVCTGEMQCERHSQEAESSCYLSSEKRNKLNKKLDELRARINQSSMSGILLQAYVTRR